MKDLTDYVLINGEEYYVENHDPHYLDKDKIAKRLEGNLQYIGYWWVKDAWGYVFRDSEPDRSKGYKDYVVIKHVYSPNTHRNDIYIAGYDEKQMQERSVQTGILCRRCKTIIWSLHRHDYHSCQCQSEDNSSVSIDGGMDYTRSSYSENTDACMVRINHLTRTITRCEKK